MKLIKKVKNLSQNNKIVLKNTMGAFLVKGFSLIISLATTPAFIRYFNNNVILGVWYTMLSVLIWFLNFDLGIGNGIRNTLVKALAQNDRDSARRIISSGIVSIGIITLILGGIGIFGISFIDLNWLFNIAEITISKSVLRLTTIFVFVAILIRFLLTTVTSIFYALQKSAINNFLSLCVSILQLLFVLIFRFDNAEKALKNLSIAYLVLSNLPVLIAAIILFSTTLRDCVPSIRYVDKKHSKAVLSIGSIFFICQILYMLIINTNEFLITKLFGPEYTTEYTFYYKITSLVSMLVTLAMTPIWSVITKATAEKDFLWLGKLYKIIKLAGIGLIALQFSIIPFSQFIFDIWLGADTIKIDYVTAIAFACFGGAFIYSSMLSTIVCGMAKMKLQTIFYSVGVVIKFIFVIVLSNFTNNWNIIVWSNALILVPYCIAEQIELNVYIKKQIKLLNQEKNEKGLVTDTET